MIVPGNTPTSPLAGGEEIKATSAADGVTGTLGLVLTGNGAPWGLTCAHIFDGCSTGDAVEAVRAAGVVGSVGRLCHDEADAAVVDLDPGIDCAAGCFHGTSLRAGSAYPPDDSCVGRQVTKVGAATGVTTARISAVHASYVAYVDERCRKYLDAVQILPIPSTDTPIPFAAPGDSGSVVLLGSQEEHGDRANGILPIVGLLTAGNKSRFYASRIDRVIAALGITMLMVSS